MSVFKSPLFNLLVVVCVFLFGISLFLLLTKEKNVQSIHLNENNQNQIAIAPSITPTIEQPREVHSIDGVLKLTMEKTSNKNNTTYDFFVSDVSGANRKLIFSQTVSNGTTMDIPDNSWSPDKRYLFVVQNENGISNALVLKASGETFADGSMYEDITSLFLDKKINYTLDTVTGWDAPGLLHVTTNGPSFWFEVSSKAFIQLATR